MTSHLESVTAERDRLLEEKNELVDLLMRRQAEFDNFRKRAEREKSEVLEFAHSESVRAILPILDDFERALKTHTADKVYARGMELIYQRLADALKKLGLETITTKGQKFDPHVHHAVDMVETADVEEQTILDEYQPGYNFRGAADHHPPHREVLPGRSVDRGQVARGGRRVLVGVLLDLGIDHGKAWYAHRTGLPPTAPPA